MAGDPFEISRSTIREMIREELAHEAVNYPDYDSETIEDLAAGVVADLSRRLATEKRCPDCGHYPHFSGFLLCGVPLSGQEKCPCETRTR